MAKTTETKAKNGTPVIEGTGTKSLVRDSNKRAPARQIYNGFEIEKRWVIMTKEEDHSKGSNGNELYDVALQKGTKIEQGYILDIQVAKEMLDTLEIEPDFKPNTIRLRKFGTQYILTLKDRKETKRREVEWELDQKTFRKFWPLTKGKRVFKTRYEKQVKGRTVVFDAFTDRFLLLAEIEVSDQAELDNLPKLGMDVTNNSAWTNKTLAK